MDGELNESNSIILTDEDGKEVEFEFVDSFDFEENTYYVLIPTEDNKDEEYVILRLEKDENGDDILSTIDDDVFFLNEAQPFQNPSKAIRKRDLNVSIQGISSRKTTFRPGGNRERKLPSSKNASCQSARFGQSQCPCWRNDSRNCFSCALRSPRFNPEWWNAKAWLNASLTR